MKSIKSKVLLVQVCLALLISVLLGFSSYFIMARIFLATARDNLMLIGMEEAMELSQRIDDHREFFRDVAREELMEFYHPQFDAMGLVEHFAHFSDNFSSLSFAGLDGKEVARLIKGEVTEDRRDLSDRPFFQFALARPGEVVATEALAEEGKSPVIIFAYTLEPEANKRIGVMLGEIPLGEFSKIMLGYALGQMGETALIHFDGTILYHNREELLMSRVVDESGEAPPFLAELSWRRPGFQRSTILGEDSYVGWAPVPGQDWAVLTILPYREAMAGPTMMRNSIFAISLAVLLLGSLGALVLTRRIAGPLEGLVAVADSMTGGDLSRRASVSTEDEVGRLAASFNRMADQIEVNYRDLESQNEELRKMDRVKEALIIDITHELKTPVAKQIMQLEVLKGTLTEHPASEKVREVYQVMENNLLRQQNTIENLLMVSRLESGGRRMEAGEVDLDGILEEIVEEYRHALDAFGVEVEQEKTKVTVMSDREMLHPIFANLLENAIKYRSAEDPRITLRVTEAEGLARISVSDNGIGMTEEEQQNVFERFYQATPSAPGIGVGLSLSKMIVEKLGGVISVASEGEGRGTTATVTLSLRGEPLRPAGGEERSSV